MSTRYVSSLDSVNDNEINYYIPSSQAKRLSMNDLAAIKVIKLEPGKRKVFYLLYGYRVIAMDFSVRLFVDFSLWYGMLFPWSVILIPYIKRIE